jgi:DNA-binding MarR family transcriptional regulator
MGEKSFDLRVSNFIGVLSLLFRRVRSAVASHELSLTQTMTMARLAKDGPLTAADLARSEGMKPQSMGTVIAELESLGLVERKAHPTDGRQRMVELTGKGVSVRKTASDEKRNWLAQAMAQLDEREQEILFSASEILQRLVEK